MCPQETHSSDASTDYLQVTANIYGQLLRLNLLELSNCVFNPPASDSRSLLCSCQRHHKWVYPSYGWRSWGWNGAGVGVVAGGWRSTSLRERDCLALEEPWRRDECRSTRALSLRVTFLLGGKVGIRVRETRKDGTSRRGGK